jgi:hypothetical protein
LWDRFKEGAGRLLGGAKRIFRSPLGKWAARVFKWANIILGSLGKVLPGVGSTEEFKQVLETGLDEVE